MLSWTAWGTFGEAMKGSDHAFESGVGGFELFLRCRGSYENWTTTDPVYGTLNVEIRNELHSQTKSCPVLYPAKHYS